MATRQDLQELLETLAGNSNVYFQPPTNIQISYPAIVYNRDFIKADHADNAPYNLQKRYQITVIDRDPDSLIPDKVSMLPTASFDRQLITDNLYHNVFNVYF